MKKIYSLLCFHLLWLCFLLNAEAAINSGPGESCETSVEAIEGANTLPSTAVESYWYSFTMPREGKLNISSAENHYLEVYSNNCTNLYYKGYGYGNASVADIAAGESVFVRWYANGAPEFSWDLSITDYVEGDVCSLAAVAVEGANTLPVTYGQYWYSFTMPQAGKLSISSVEDYYLEVSSNSCENPIYKGYGFGNTSVAGLSEGENIFIHWYASNGTEFSWNLAVEENAEGDLCSLAAAAVEGANTVPATSGEYWYSFTMPREGKLNISSEAGEDVRIYGGTCDNLSSLGGGWRNASITGLTAGEQVYIRWRGSNGGNFSWNLSVTEYAEGDLCSLAAVAVEGSNTVTATSGEYWYSFTMPMDGKLNINSEASEGVYVYSNTCDNLNYLGQGWTNLSISNLAAGEQVYIRWRMYNGGDFSWNLAAEEYAEGDLCSLAAAAVEGLNTVTATSGEYWYSFTMPMDGKLNISSEASEGVEIYSNTCDNLNYLGQGWPNASITGLTAGEQVYIRWEIYNGGNFSWNLEAKEYGEGDFCSLAAEAVEGSNTVTATAGEYWYSFTMPQDGKLNISSEASEGVYVYSNTCDNLNYLGQGWPNASITGITAGEEVYIRWRINNGGNFSWNLSVTEYAEGDLCSLAAAAVEGSNTVTATSGEYWYSFTMPMDGKFNISTEAYESVEVYSNTCDNLNYLGYGYRNASISGLAAGEQVYIRWRMYNGGNFSWNLSVSEYAEGDLCSLAAAAVEGSNTVTATAGEYWYSFTMPMDGKLNISTEAYESVEVYSNTCDNLNYLGYGYRNASISGLAAGEQVYIRWRMYNGGNFDWNLAVTEYAEGDLCSLAATAVEGSNTVTATAGEYWYSFTMPMDGKLNISTEAYESVAVYNNTCDNLNFLGDGWRNASISGLAAGDQVYIRWNISDGGNFNWSLVVEEVVESNICSQAVEAVEGTNTSPVAPYWFSFIMPQNGDLTISSMGTTSNNTDLRVYDGCEGLLLAENDDFDYDNGIYQSEVILPGLSQGDAVYILWQDSWSNESFDWTITVAAPSKTSQTISFTAIDDQLLSAGSVLLDATASSGLTVSYVVTAGTATVSGNTLSFTEAGSVTVVASQAGNEEYEAAEPVSQTFCVNPEQATISIQNDEAPVEGVTLVSSSATGNQWYRDGVEIAGAVEQTYVTSTKGLYTVQVFAGTCASPESNAIQIGKINQTISFATISDHPLSAGSVLLDATASSGLGVSYEVTAGSATVSGNTLSFSEAGSVTVVASQAGNEEYEAAEPVSRTFCVNPDQPTISVADGGSAVVGATLVSSSATGNQWYKDGAVISGATADTYVTTDAGVYYTVQVSAEGCSSAISEGLSVEPKSNQTINFIAIDDQLLSAGSIELQATASSGLAVSYEVTAGSATVSGSTLSFTAAGTVTVVATQAGNEEYEAAEPVSQTFCVNPDKPTVSVADGGNAVVGATLVSSSATGNQWYKDGAVISGATADTYVATEAGLYTLQVSAGSCSSDMFDGIVIEAEVTGIADDLEGLVKSLYPNPTLGIVNLEFETLKSGKEISVSVIDVKGSKVNVATSVKMQQNGKSLVQVDMSGLESGLYYFLIKDGDKLIKAKVHKM